jgi:hypothetical protein
MFLGFILAAGSVICQAKTATLIGLALPACALGVPIIDAAFTMVRRGILDRRSVFAAERGHIHHRLLGMGLRQRHVVIIIYGVTLASAGLALGTMSLRNTEAIAVFVGVLGLLLFVFHLVGASRVRETVGVIKRDFARSREAHREKQSFEDAQLRMREAKSFDEWWAVLCFMSEAMDVIWIALTFTRDNGPVRTFAWRRDGPPPSSRDIITMTIPVARSRPESSLEIEAGFRVNGSLEAAGRRAGLLGRLIDESDLSTTPEILRNLGWPDVTPAPGEATAASLLQLRLSSEGGSPSDLRDERPEPKVNLPRTSRATFPQGSAGDVRLPRADKWKLPDDLRPRTE